MQALQNRQNYADALFGALPQEQKRQRAELLDTLLYVWNVPINEEEYQFEHMEGNEHGYDGSDFDPPQHAEIYVPAHCAGDAASAFGGGHERPLLCQRQRVVVYCGNG